MSGARAIGGLVLSLGIAACASPGDYTPPPPYQPDASTPRPDAASDRGELSWPLNLGGIGCDELFGFAGNAGQFALIGTTGTTVYLGGADLTPGGEQVAFVAMYDDRRGHRWSRLVGATGGAGGSGLALGPGRELVAAGSFDGTLEVDGMELTAGHDYSSFLAKFDEDGEASWVTSFGLDAPGFPPGNHALHVASSGDVFLAGSFAGRLDLGPRELISDDGSLDGFVARFSGADGELLWAERFGGTGDDAFMDVAVSRGQVWVVGGFQDQVMAGGEAIASAGGWDVIVAKYSGIGDLMYATQYGGIGDDTAQAVAIDGSEDFVVAGVFQDEVSFGGPALEDVGQRDIFVVRFADVPNEQRVNHVWSRRAGSSELDVPEDVALVGDTVAVVGGFRGSLHTGGAVLSSAGNRDGFMLQLARRDGALVAVRRAGGQSDDAIVGVVATDDQPLVGGFFEDVADLDGYPIEGKGCIDLFVAPLPVE